MESRFDETWSEKTQLRKGVTTVQRVILLSDSESACVTSYISSGYS